MMDFRERCQGIEACTGDRSVIPHLLLTTGIAVGLILMAVAFARYGMIAGMAVGCIPIGFFLLLYTMKYPPAAMLGMFVLNYFLMYISRMSYDKMPIGALLDIAVVYNCIVVMLQAFRSRVEWRQAASGITLATLVWLTYCMLEILNPQSISVKGWISSVRSVALNFTMVVILTQIVLTKFKYLQFMLIAWSVLTLAAVGKALVQKYIGFNTAENYWLYMGGGRTTHMIGSGIRYFSIYSDAANFGAGMGMAMVVFSIVPFFINSHIWKAYFMFVAAAACYGMLLSGTRSALAVPFAGYAMSALLSPRAKTRLLSIIVLVGALLFLRYTNIGQGNQLIRRARSAFNTNDPSLQVRLQNQQKLRALMVDKPFGAGLGHGGGKAKVFAPNAPLSQIPTDSWYVMLWVETGIVGLILYILVLLSILARGGYLVLFKLHEPRVRGITMALTSGVTGVAVMAYANEVMGQIPTGVIMYICIGFIALAPRFDRELSEATAAKEAQNKQEALGMDPNPDTTTDPSPKTT